MMDKYYFYQSYYYSLKGLKRETRYAIREAIDEFMFEDKEPNFKDALSNSIWMLLLPTLSKSKTKYENAKGKRQANQEQNESEIKANQKRNESKNEIRPSISISKEDGERNMDKGEKKDKEKSAKAASLSRFVKPTLEQVRAYISEKGYHFDAEAFFAFYESKGWKVGNAPMKSWEAACVTWEKREPHQEEKPEKEYHPITPLTKCKVCGSRNVVTRGMYANCLNGDCCASFVWSSNAGDWREE